MLPMHGLNPADAINGDVFFNSEIGQLNGPARTVTLLGNMSFGSDRWNVTTTRLVLGYADAQVNALLDIDGEREATLALCALGRGGTVVTVAGSPLPVPEPVFRRVGRAS